MVTNDKWLNPLIVFLFSFAILFGPAFALFDSFNYDFIASPDLGNYLGLANLDFDQSPVRKYRVIVPFLAAGVNFIFGPIFTALSPDTFPGPDFSMCMSFFLVNTTLMSIFGVLVYRLCREFGASHMAALIGLLSVLTCRWTFYLAGLPYVDSLYLVVIGMTLLGIKTKNSTLIIASIMVGPWAKESFLFIAPLIFFFSHISKLKQIVLFIISAAVVFAFRYFVDAVSGTPFNESLHTDINHLSNIADSLRRLFSFHGVYEVISIFGLWGLLFFFLLRKNVRDTVSGKTPVYFLIYIVIVLVHALLSTDLARMFYLATPVLAVWFALIWDEISFFTQKQLQE